MVNPQATPEAGPLIFIDTSSLLPFYEELGDESGLSILQDIEGIKDRLILTEQVLMEFLKHRQQKLIALHNRLKEVAKGDVHPPPAFLKPNSDLEAKRKELNALVDAERAKVAAMLRDPRDNDPIYHAIVELGRASNRLVLLREHLDYADIARRAHERYSRGDPPRKAGDTSFGDAISWEWIVACACRESRDVVIVTRDSDYGPPFGKKNERLVNDWLAHEFATRTSRSVSVVSLLADAFRQAGKPLREDQEQAELATLPIASPVTGSTRVWTFPSPYGDAVNVYSVPLNTSDNTHSLDEIIDRQMREAIQEIKRVNAGGHPKLRGTDE